MNWGNRHDATTIEEAMEALHNATILHAYTIVGGGPETSFTLLGQMREYAACWKIPFDQQETYRLAQRVIRAEEDEFENSQSCYDDSSEGGWNASFC